MNWIRYFSILIFCGFILGGWPQAVPAQVLQQTFSDSLANFSISSPNDQWYFTPRSITPGPVRATLRFQVPVDKFVPNVTVRVIPVRDPNLKLKDLVEEDMNSLPKGVEVQTKKEIKHGKLEGYEIQIKDPQAKVQFLQWIFLAKGKSFVITGAATESAWPRVEGDIKKILNSFKIR